MSAVTGDGAAASKNFTACAARRFSDQRLQSAGCCRPDDPLFRWLWKDSPIAKIGYSIFIYDLTDRPDDLRRLKETYRKAGIPAPP